MKKLTVALVVLLGGALAACAPTYAEVGYASPGYGYGYSSSAYYSSYAPPRPLVEVVGTAPGDNYVWVNGYWGWSGGRWVWRPGRWTVAPYDNYAWVPSGWTRYGSRYRFVPGRWAPRHDYYRYYRPDVYVHHPTRVYVRPGYRYRAVDPRYQGYYRGGYEYRYGPRPQYYRPQRYHYQQRPYYRQYDRPPVHVRPPPR